jgi:hypothetical protein
VNQGQKQHQLAVTLLDTLGLQNIRLERKPDGTLPLLRLCPWSMATALRGFLAGVRFIGARCVKFGLSNSEAGTGCAEM